MFVCVCVCVCTSLCVYMCVSLHVQVYVCMPVWHVSDYDDDKEDLRSMGCLSMLQRGVYVCI